MRYSRDMRGHGEVAPDPAWPGGARIAVQIVVNYEEGGENSVEHGDAASEAFLSEIVGAQPWPGQRHWNMESIYDYGARAGFWRLYRLLEGIPVTCYGVATALARSPEQTRAMIDAGWEMATHGLKWIDYKDVPREVEADHIARAVELHTQVTGSRPLGFYQGRASMNTVALGCEEGGFAYLADSYADELPYWHLHDGRPQLIVPYTLDAEDELDDNLRGWLAIAAQKYDEVGVLARALRNGRESEREAFEASAEALATHASDPRVHVPAVRARLAAVTDTDVTRMPAAERSETVMTAAPESDGTAIIWPWTVWLPADIV